MTSEVPSPTAVDEAEIAALIETLHESAQRLEILTLGQVDSVADQDGHMFLLRHAQEHLRNSDAMRQATVLNALPANIALLDDQGVIISVNEAWRRFAHANLLQAPDYAIGTSYLEICASAQGSGSMGGEAACHGIVSVLAGREPSFSIEYPCHSPTEQRWFLCLVAALVDEKLSGAVVMHIDITERKLVESRLHRLNRLHSVLSKVGEIIVTTRTRKALYEAVCRIVVEDGLLRMAFIADADADSGLVQPVAAHGVGQDAMTELSCLIPTSGENPFRGPIATALRTGAHDVCNDIVGTEWMKPRHAASSKHGLLANAAFPLKLQGGTVGLLVLYAGEVDYFQNDEITLMDDVAQTISFALEAQENERQRELADIALRTSEASMSVAQRIAHFGSWELDLTDPVDVDTNPLRWSDEMFRIAGYEPGAVEVSSAFFFDHVPEEEHAAIREAVAEAIRTHGPYSIVHRMIRPGGEERIVREMGQISFDKNTGKPLKIIGAAHDITKRRQAESAMQALSREKERQERVLHSMLASTADFAYIFDREGRFVFANQPLLDLWGLSLDAAVGKNFFDLGYPDVLAAKLQGQIEEVFKTGNMVTDETPYTSPAGHEGFYEYIFSPGIAADGTIEFVVGSTRVVTERKRSELEMLRINKDLLASQIRIKYMNRVHAVLSGINALIVRVHDRDELFAEACRVAVDEGGFRMAMIVTADPATGAFAPVASAGKDEVLLGAIRELLGSPELAATTMVVRSMREKSALVSHDLTNDPRVLLVRHYVDAGIRSLAVLPLIVANIAVGTLVLYASEAELFHAEEMKLLTELSGDIAFAIDHIGKRERLEYLAHYDELTGLPNRNLLFDRVAQRLSSAARGGHQLAVLLFDIERFKSINDSLGRPAGDALLKQVADWLIREIGDAPLLARLGADHFAVVLPEAKLDGEVARFLEKTMAELAHHPFRLDEAELRITIKAGVALFPDDGNDVETLFQHAEAALKKAKASGSRFLFFGKAMSDKVAGKLTLENKLKLAIDNEEFVLHYQPKVDLATGKVTGAEALIRWNDPSSGLVAPYMFVPILEETGLIHEVGRWALRKAVADYLRWRDAGLPAPRIAVNVSALQLRDHGFVDEIRQVLGADALASAGLELEITESMIMEDVKHAIASLHAIRGMGVPIAIDDFGTGFSSLGYLSKLPIDTLKVDRSFVIEMTTSADGLALVSTIINLAQSLRLKVVAEGVETEEQRRLLQLLRCDEMQGFLFSKPVPGDVFETQFLAPRQQASAIR